MMEITSVSWRTSTRYRRLATIGQNLAASLLTLLLISIIAFAGTSSSGQTVARNILGRGVTTAQLDAYAQSHGLDRPVYVRYGEWLRDFARGDWGVSPATQRSVASDVLPRFKNTLILAIASLVVSVPLSIFVGLFMARRIGRWPDMTLLVVFVITAAMPEFVLGLGLVMLFAVTLGVLPVDSTALTFGTPLEKVIAYVLPATTLSLGVLPYVSRVARSSVSEALVAPYTRAAILRGLSPARIVWRHVMPNAAVPLINAIAINIVYLLSGVIVVENVFAFPGIGQLLVQAIGHGDTSTVLAITMVLGATFITMSFVVDLLIVYFNPKLKAST
jgi:peptide/nickel transport system permease protein